MILRAWCLDNNVAIKSVGDNKFIFIFLDELVKCGVLFDGP